MIAIIPAAGLGTRFLPFTKSVPKELVPIMGTPSIQYIIKEALDNGIRSFVVITSAQKNALKDYLTVNNILNTELEQKNKGFLLKEINNIISQCNIHFINQDAPLGLGHAVLCAKQYIQNVDPYITIMLPDELLFSNKHFEITLLEKMHKLAVKYSASIIAVKKVLAQETEAYGIIKAKSLQEAEGCFLVEAVVEKPAASQAPSCLAIIGRYVLEKAIFEVLPSVPAGSGGEIQLTDGIAALINKGRKVIAYEYTGNRFDVGNPTGWLAANIFINTN